MSEQVTRLARAEAEMPHLTLVLDPTAPPPQPRARHRCLSHSWLPWEPPASPSSLGWNQQSCLHRKDESKEPIVEVRTEEERTPNHDGGKHTEPNETTPLTEPEYVGGAGCHLLGRASQPPHHPAHSSMPPTYGSPAERGRLEFWSAGPGTPDPTLSLERRHS